MNVVGRLETADAVVDWQTRGFLQPEGSVAAGEFAAAGRSLFDGSFTWPIMVARRSALDHNIATLAGFVRERGLALAPHGKTTMAPSLFQAQLDAGAWGISAATASQVLVYRRVGVPRVLLANEIFDEGALRWLAGELGHFEFLCFVDSVEGVRLLDRYAGDVPFRVLVELGHQGGRTGCRGLPELLRVAEAAREARGVELAGAACYEGTQPGEKEVRAFLREFAEAAKAVAPLVEGRMVVSAGGSAWFDLVADELAPLARADSGPGALVVLRSGAYVAHDEGFYRERTPYNRGGSEVAGAVLEGELHAALEVWAQVLSVPEPGLALVGMGKRDVPYDLDLPFVHAVRPASGDESFRTGVPDGMRVEKVQDQHAYLSIAPGVGLRPGDLVSFGISHPCTAFDKWRVIPVVDDDYVVIDLIKTYF
ncbi:alanine racemase [Planotetraspora kaengkrachanensis]|uniref:Amino acid deaminase n=1 Tax=Planotetraspora kaengkrachanensis TaxID=575193 RepID=A0A8J3PW09_9ACTN|nr:alanine racemase [Planotetraspora kaengkrachanensis]GIG81966.1 amino acid deaminase [Planotetraspora kaengkrachanensis]